MISEGVSVVTKIWNERENIEKLILTVKNVLRGVPTIAHLNTKPLERVKRKA